MKRAFAKLGALICVLSAFACGGGGADSPPASNSPAINTGAVASIVLSPANVSDYWGYTVQMQAAVKDAAGGLLSNAGVTWASSDPNVATVDGSGLVTLKTKGAVKITASAGLVSSSASDVTVEGFSTLLATSSEDNCSTNEARTQILCWGDGYPIYPNRPLLTQYANPVSLQMGAIPAGAKIKQVAPSFPMSCALTDEGDAYCWRGGLSDSKVSALGTATGSDPNTPQKVVQGERPTGVTFKKISVNQAISACGLGSDDEVYCWGEPFYVRALVNKPSTVPVIYAEPKKMQRGALAPTDSIVDIALGINNDCGITALGKPFCWIASNNGTLPTFLAPGAIPVNTKLLELRTDKSGAFVALGDDGWAYTWGNQEGYRAGDGSSAFIADQFVPRRIAQGEIPANEKIVKVAAGGIVGAHCVLSDANSVYCWGIGNYGSLANNNLAVNQNVASPKKAQVGAIPSDVKLIDIACGTYHCSVMGSNRKVYAWGGNEGAALGVTGPDSGVPVEISRILK